MRISISYAIHESAQDSPEEETSPTPTATAFANAYASLAKNTGHSLQTSSMIPSMDTVLEPVLEQWKTIEQRNLTEVSEHLGGFLKNFGQNYANTYATLQNRSKLIEQQAKELDKHEPDNNEEA